MGICTSCGGRGRTSNMTVKMDDQGNVIDTPVIEWSCGTCGGTGHVQTDEDRRIAMEQFEALFHPKDGT